MNNRFGGAYPNDYYAREAEIMYRTAGQDETTDLVPEPPVEDDDTLGGPFGCRGVALGCLLSAVFWVLAALVCRGLLR